MVQNFIFSVGIALPIFLVLCIGYFLRSKEIINEEFVKCSNIMIFNIALPIKLFNDMLHNSFSQYFDIKFIMFTSIGIIVSASIVAILGKMIIKDKTQLGAFIHGAFRGNFLYIGLSLMENITGSIGTKAPLIITFIIPLYNVLAVIILTATKNSKLNKENFKFIVKKVIKNPLIVAIVLGGIASQLGIKFPKVATKTMEYFRQLVTPLALLTIGATFNFKKSFKNLKVSLYASVMKLIILPGIAVGAAILSKFSNEDVLLIYILFGVPTSVVSYIMTLSMDGDGDLAANIIMMTTMFSVLSITIFIFIFKTVGII